MRNTLCSVIALLATSGAGQGGTIYQTGFEPPTFSPGTLNGQGGWAAIGSTSSTVVETSMVESGTQAVEVLPSASSGDGGLLSAPFGTALAGQIVDFSIDADFSATGTPSFWTALDTVYNGSPGNIDFNIDPSGQMHVFVEGTDHPTGVDITRGVWNQYMLQVNFINDTVSAFYNGAPVLSGAAFSPTGTTLDFVAFYSQTGATSDEAFFDNLSVATVPEPDTFALLLGAGVLLFGSGVKARLGDRGNRTATASSVYIHQ